MYTPISAASILAEIGDIRRFKNSSSLVAYAGIDPTIRQSGEYCSTHNRMSIEILLNLLVGRLDCDAGFYKIIIRRIQFEYC